jgi:hypothetical protein
MFLFKKHNVSETAFCLRLQAKPTQLDPIDREIPYLRTPKDGDSMQSPKRHVSK